LIQKKIADLTEQSNRDLRRFSVSETSKSFGTISSISFVFSLSHLLYKHMRITE